MLGVTAARAVFRRGQSPRELSDAQEQAGILTSGQSLSGVHLVSLHDDLAQDYDGFTPEKTPGIVLSLER